LLLSAGDARLGVVGIARVDRSTTFTRQKLAKFGFERVDRVVVVGLLLEHRGELVDERLLTGIVRRPCRARTSLPGSSWFWSARQLASTSLRPAPPPDGAGSSGAGPFVGASSGQRIDGQTMPATPIFAAAFFFATCGIPHQLRDFAKECLIQPRGRRTRRCSIRARR
jgi:hypothetical protein